MGDTRCHDSVEAIKRFWFWISIWDPQSGRKSSSARRWVHQRGSLVLLCLAFASYQLFSFLRGLAGSYKEKSNQSSKCFCPSEPKTTCLFSSKSELGLAFSHLFLLTGDWGVVIVLTLSSFPTAHTVIRTCIFDWVGDAVSGTVPLGSLRKIPSVSLFLLAQAHERDWQTLGSHCSIYLVDEFMLLKCDVSEVWIQLSPFQQPIAWEAKHLFQIAL